MNLPSYIELKNTLQLKKRSFHFIAESRKTIQAILNGSDPRFLIIVGPCSIHDIAGAKEFAHKLKQLSLSLASQIFIVMRTYCEKPRTTCGWKGLLYDPLLNGSHDISKGLFKTRQLFLDLADLELPTAAEFLDPLTAYYYEDLVSWGSIGARTSSSQTHRQLASALPLPIGIKNTVGGNLLSAVEGVVSISQPHTFIGLNEQGKKSIITSSGNRDAHIVLRGSIQGPNYHSKDVEEALKQLQNFQLPPRLIIDCAHHNSNKMALQQPLVFKNILEQKIKGNKNIRGLMLESYLKLGNQSVTQRIEDLKYGLSITDPCLDWEMTKELLIEAFTKFKTHTSS